MISDFDVAIKTRLLASTYNKDLIELPKYSTVPYWQGTGTGNTFADKSKINVKIEGQKELEINVDGPEVYETDAEKLFKIIDCRFKEFKTRPRSKQVSSSIYKAT